MLADRLPAGANIGAFHFYNETRKRQVIAVLRRLGMDAPVYPGDAEVLLRWGRAKDGARILAVCVSGHDDLESLPLDFGAAAPEKAERLRPDGTWAPVAVRRGAKGEVVFESPVGFLDIAVFRLR